MFMSSNYLDNIFICVITSFKNTKQNTNSKSQIFFNKGVALGLFNINGSLFFEDSNNMDSNTACRFKDARKNTKNC